MLPAVIKHISAVLFTDKVHGKKTARENALRPQPSARTAAAVRVDSVYEHSRHDVERHVSRPRDAHHGVHVRAVVIQESARAVNERAISSISSSKRRA
jgi:hypothetical protein